MPTAATAFPATSIAAAICSGLSSLGHACASATPNAGGSAVSRSVTVSGWNRPPTEKPLTVNSRPFTCSSTSTVALRDASSATSTAEAIRRASATSDKPRCPCRSGAFTTQGKPTRSAAATASRAPEQITNCGCGISASAKRSRWRTFDVERAAVLDPPPPRLILAVPADRPRKPLVEGGARVPPGQPRDLVGRPDVPVDLPRPLGDECLQRRGLPERLEHLIRDLPDGDVHAGRHVQDFTGDVVERCVDHRLDRLGVVLDEEPIAGRVAVAVNGEG